MDHITNITASQRVLAHLHEGRLVQGTFHVEEHGRELACILGAISPNIVSDKDCPATIMPRWMACLVIPMFDGQVMAAAMTWAGRFGQQMARWHVLDDAAWGRVRESFCSAVVADAKRSSDSTAARAAQANAADEYAACAASAAATAAALAARTAAHTVACFDEDNAADGARWAAIAAQATAAESTAAARQACWTRLAKELCDLIHKELAN
jgi:hypothetical protein